MRNANRYSNWESHLRHSEWHLDEFHTGERWVSNFTCKSDMMFQIVIRESSDERQDLGEWSKGLPDPSCYTCLVDLRFAGAGLKTFEFAVLDGGRYLVPIPDLRMVDVADRKSEAVEYIYEGDSLEFLVAKVIGHFYIDNSLEGFARRQGIRIRQCAGGRFGYS